MELSLAILPTELLNIRGLAPMAGRFEAVGESICFVPRFPFVNATSYSLVVAGVEAGTIVRPARAGPPTTRVVGVYPSARSVPLNLLKIYVHFSAPMSEGESAGAVHVRRVDTGAILDGVFLPMDPELWDRQRRRLTLLLDPGRIKRGLAPHEEAGYPLMNGVPVAVVIEPSFRDAEGRPLVSGSERRYQVGPAVRTTVDPALWHCDPPAAGSTGPLIIRFDRPLDHALLEHSLVVRHGEPLSGESSPGPDEAMWQFAPGAPWRPGRHVVTVDPKLEDLAGNSLTRVFDRDLTRPEDVPREVPPVAMEFDCR